MIKLGGQRMTIKAFGKVEPIDPTLIPDLVAQMRDGKTQEEKDHAKELMIVGHMALAGAIAATYANKVGKDPQEMMAVCMHALCEVVERIQQGKPDHDNYGGYISKSVNGSLSNFLERDHLIKPGGLGNKDTTWDVPVLIELSNEMPYKKPDYYVLQIFESDWFTTAERTILRMRWEGYGDKEIAEKLGRPLATVNRMRLGMNERVHQWLKRNS